MHKRAAFVTCLSLIGPRLAAQPCDGTNSRDSLPASLVAYFTVAGDRDSVPQADADNLAAQLRSSLHLPDPVPTPVWTLSIGLAAPVLHGDYELRIDRDGTIHDVRIARSSLVGAIDSGVVGALQASALPPRQDRSRLVLHVSLITPQEIPHLVAKPTMAPGIDTTKHIRRSHVDTLVVFTHKVPVWPDARLPIFVRMGHVPQAAARIRGTVQVDAVIDENGRVVHGSVYHPFPVNEEAFQIARSVAEGYEFKAATINGCPLKFFMIIPMAFAGPR